MHRSDLAEAGLKRKTLARDRRFSEKRGKSSHPTRHPMTVPADTPAKRPRPMLQDVSDILRRVSDLPRPTKRQGARPLSLLDVS